LTYPVSGAAADQAENFVLIFRLPEVRMSETRKLAAILVADVVGYSRLAGIDEDRTLARLRGLRSDLIDPAIAAHHGRIVKRTGDGSIIEFRSVVDAVRCAIEVQTGMVERNAGLPPERRIEFRVGIHLGDVVEEADGDLMGDGVNIAARLERVAKPGAICLSEDAYRQVKSRLDLTVTDLGPTQLKNIVESIRIYSLEVGKPAHAKPVTVAAPEKSVPPRLSIVVLPFKNLSGDSSQDYFADGVTKNLTTDLSRIRNSFVIARNTAFTFKDKAVDAKQIAKELGVRYVLEGSVQRNHNRVRVNAQLIDGETGAHLWADRFQEDVADLFKLQDDVVARLANALSDELVTAEAKAAAGSKNPDSIDLVMRGRGAILHWAQQPPTKDELAAVRALFERALEIDPKNADALAGSAHTYMIEYAYGPSDPETDYDAKVLGQADGSIALARDNAWAYGVKSIYLNISCRPNDALRVANAGLALNSNYALLFAWRSSAETYLGQFEQAKSDVQQAMRLSPRDPRISNWHNLMADAELGLGNFDAAIEAASTSIDAGFRVFYSHLNLAAAHALKGDMDQAKAPLAEARRLNPKLSVKWLTARKPILQTAFDALRRAGLPEE
jgi:adenylate cyclase